MLEEALKRYGFESSSEELIRHNENMTYRIVNDSKTYVLRIHNPVEGFDLGILRMGTDAHEMIEGEMKPVSLHISLVR